MKWLLCFVLVAAIAQHECRTLAGQKKKRDDDSDFNVANWCARLLDLDLASVPNPFEDIDAPIEGNREYRKFTRCLLVKIGVVRRDGSLNLDRFDDYIDAVTAVPADQIEAVDEQMEPCKGIRGRNAEDTAVKLNMCVAEVVSSLDLNNEEDEEDSECPAAWCAHVLDLDLAAVPSLQDDLDEAVEDNEDYRKLIRCIYMREGVVKRDGTIDDGSFDAHVEGLVENMDDKDDVANDLQDCRTVEAEDAEEMAVKLDRCFVQVLHNWTNTENP